MPVINHQIAYSLSMTYVGNRSVRIGIRTSKYICILLLHAYLSVSTLLYQPKYNYSDLQKKITYPVNILLVYLCKYMFQAFIYQIKMYINHTENHCFLYETGENDIMFNYIFLPKIFQRLIF